MKKTSEKKISQKGTYMVKGPANQEDVMILNVYGSKNSYEKWKLEIDD